jgi:putative transposase
MARASRRRRVEPTDDWEQLELLCLWPEQRDYELIRPLVLFGSPASERAQQTGAASERTLQRKSRSFEAEGVESLFGSEHARARQLPPAVRRLIVDLKAEYPGFNLNEISNACYVLFGRRPDHKTVRRILAEEPIPLRIARRFPPYHEIPERRERRLAVVTLHAEGWTSKAISGYLGVHKSAVHRILKRWVKEGADGLEDRPHGRPSGVRKVTLKAMEAVRRLQQNPNLGEYRIHAALAQIGIHLSPRTCGRILATHRELYGLEKPKGPIKEKRRMPFAARRRHQYWTSDVRYVDHGLGGRVYVVSVMDNLQPRHPRERPHTFAGPFLLPRRALRGGREVRLPGGAGHRRREDLPRQAGYVRLRVPRDSKARDRERKALAKLHRNDVQHPA